MAAKNAKYTVSKLANRNEQAEAKKVSSFKVTSPEEWVAILWGIYGAEVEPYLYYEYKDQALNNWFIRLREILNNETIRNGIIRESNEQQRKFDAEDEDEMEWFVDMVQLTNIFKPWNVPPELIGLAKYQNRKKEGLLKSFSIDSDGEWISEMSKSISTKNVKLFASTGDGSYIGYWVKKSLAESPIVFVDHDIIHSQVIAKNIREFLAILLSPPSKRKRTNEEVGFYGVLEYISEEGADWVKLKRWIKRNCQIEPLPDRHLVITQAEKMYGSFEKWLSRRL